MNSKNIMRMLGLLALGIPVTQTADATYLSPQQALERIQSAPTGKRIVGSDQYKLTYTGKSGEGTALYVFNKGDNGFVVASADDRMPAVLGYSDNGAFDIEKASPELKWWLSQYVDEAASYLKNAGELTEPRVKVRRETRPEIETMVKTTWDQGAPYNEDCPEDQGGRCVTGCVATALAQVLNYHRYPVSGKGTHSYDYQGNTYSFDYGAATFDWDNMLDNYDYTATEEQKSAVAELMYACGVGVNMSYSSSASGAQDPYIAYALKEYFNYDDGVRNLERRYFSTAEWEDIIYNELSEGRPVLYSGQAPTGGHEFVCDGYADGYFHINWGWSGYGNGMFLLSALDPGLQGIGGFEGGYNADQGATIGIQPSESGNYPWYPIYANEGIVPESVDGNVLYVGFSGDGGVYNYSPENVTVEFLLNAVSEETGGEFIGESVYALDFPGCTYVSDTGSSYYSGYSTIIMAIPSEMPAGNYKAYPMFKTPEGTLQNMLIPRTGASYVGLTVGADGSVVISEGTPEEKAELRVTEFKPQTRVEPNVETEFDITVENIGEIDFSGAIYANIFRHGDEDILQTNGIRLSIAAGETLTGYVGLTYDFEIGQYDVIFSNANGEAISDVFTFYIGMDEPVEPEYVELDYSDIELETGDSMQLHAIVYPENASDRSVVWSSSDEGIVSVNDGLVTGISEGEAIITAMAANGVYSQCYVLVKEKAPEVIYVSQLLIDPTYVDAIAGDVIQLTATVLPENATNKTLTWTSSDEEVASVDATGLVTINSVGSATVTASTTDGSGLTATCTLVGNTGINQLIDKGYGAEIFTAGGLLIKSNADNNDIRDLAKGLYIVKISGKTYKMIK